MTSRKCKLLSFLVLVVLFSVGLFLFQGFILKKSGPYPKDKPGLAEIHQIAEDNDLSPSEVKLALKPPEWKLSKLPIIFLSQAISIGFVLGMYALIHAVVSGLFEKEQEKAQQRPSRRRG